MTIETLSGLEPLGALPRSRLAELTEQCHKVSVKKGLDPFRFQGVSGQSVYLVGGVLSLSYATGDTVVIRAGSEFARHPLGKGRYAIRGAKALSDVELLRLDDDIVDILAIWSAAAPAPDEQRDCEVFSLKNLKYGALSRLPAANVEALLAKLEKVPVRAGDVVIRQGEEGDYYYLIESGAATVTRAVGGVAVVLAKLKCGDAFGEEALVSGARRNATVTVTEDGTLLRLCNKDFSELLKEPLLNRLTLEQAQQKAAAGAVWIDARYPPEYRQDKMPGAINIPVSQIRTAIGVLSREREYIVYCQSGQRSSAAAFLLTQYGYRAYLLEGGLASAGIEQAEGLGGHEQRI